MTMKITPLQEITPDKGKVKIKVKIVSLWNQYYSNNNPSKLDGVDMILMDEGNVDLLNNLILFFYLIFMFKGL